MGLEIDLKYVFRNFFFLQGRIVRNHKYLPRRRRQSQVSVGDETMCLKVVEGWRHEIL
jgi:hypothetical protein